MKYLTDRQIIAKAMNFGKYPVLHIDRETPKNGYEGFFEGDLVKVMTPSPRHPDLYEVGNLYYCDGRYAISAHMIGLHADFGYSDVIEQLKTAQAPVVHKGDVVVVIEDYPKVRTCAVRVMKVEHVTSFTYPCATLTDVDDDFQI